MQSVAKTLLTVIALASSLAVFALASPVKVDNAPTRDSKRFYGRQVNSTPRDLSNFNAVDPGFLAREEKISGYIKLSNTFETLVAIDNQAFAVKFALDQDGLVFPNQADDPKAWVCRTDWMGPWTRRSLPAPSTDLLTTILATSYVNEVIEGQIKHLIKINAFPNQTESEPIALDLDWM